MSDFRGDVAGESISAPLKVGFDRRLKLQFHGAKLSSDGGLFLFRELDDALGLTGMASWELRDNRTGRNARHDLLAMFRQSLFGRVAGYEDVNDAGRLSRDPVMRLIAGQRDFDRFAASESQMGRFETNTLALQKNLAALADLSVSPRYRQSNFDVTGSNEDTVSSYLGVSIVEEQETSGAG